MLSFNSTFNIIPIQKLLFFSVPRFYSNPDENVPFGSKDKEAFYVKTSQPINDTEFTKVLEANGNMNDELEKWVRHSVEKREILSH